MRLNRITNWTVVMAAVFSTLLGLVALVGWHTHNIVFIQIFPQFAPMQYNTALCFLLCGLGLFAFVFDQSLAGVLLGGIVGAVGILTLSEYIFGINLGVDQLLMKAYLTTRSSQPGRMAPNTAFCFVNVGLIFLTCRLTQFRMRLFAGWILGSLVISAGFIALLGYAAGIETAHSWGHFTDMAPQTALGFLILGIGMIAFVQHQAEKSTQRGIQWFPVIVTLSFIMAALFLWNALKRQEDVHIRRTIELGSTAVKKEFEEVMESRVLSLNRMAGRWETRGGTPEKEWRSDAENYVRDNPDYQAVGWVNPAFEVRWIIPLEGNEKAVGVNLGLEERRRTALKQAQDKNETTVTHAIDLVQGGKGFVVYVPPFPDKGFDGFISGVFRVQQFVETILNEDTLSRYSIEIFDGEENIYSHSIPQAKKGQTSEIKINLRGVVWRMRIGLNPEYLQKLGSPLKTVTLIFGIVMSVLLGLTTYLIQLVRFRAGGLKELNQKLKNEIGERQGIEVSLELRAKELKSQRTAALNIMQDAEEARKRTEEAEDQLKGKCHEFETLNKIMMGREERILKLKEQVRELEAQRVAKIPGS